MPRNGKLKPRIKPSETFESVIHIWKYGTGHKNFSVSTCTNCFRKLLDKSISIYDKSRYKNRKNLKSGNEFTIHKVDGIYNNPYKGLYAPYPFTCDFCKGGKKIEDFI